jgi:hypothetical protein
LALLSAGPALAPSVRRTLLRADDMASEAAEQQRPGGQQRPHRHDFAGDRADSAA